jgi:flagellar biosynthesis protein FliP
MGQWKTPVSAADVANSTAGAAAGVVVVVLSDGLCLPLTAYTSLIVVLWHLRRAL